MKCLLNKHNRLSTKTSRWSNSKLSSFFQQWWHSSFKIPDLQKYIKTEALLWTQICHSAHLLHWIFQPSTLVFMALFSSILSYLRLYNHTSVKSVAQRRCLVTVCWADLSSTQLQQRCCPLLYCVLRQCIVLSQEPLPSCNRTYQLKYVNISPPTGIHHFKYFHVALIY